MFPGVAIREEDAAMRRRCPELIRKVRDACRIKKTHLIYDLTRDLASDGFKMFPVMAIRRDVQCWGDAAWT